MKRKLYSILSLLLISVMLFSLASCAMMDASAPNHKGEENLAVPEVGRVWLAPE